jgi:hypothetical protein
MRFSSTARVLVGCVLIGIGGVVADEMQVGLSMTTIISSHQDVLHLVPTPQLPFLKRVQALLDASGRGINYSESFTLDEVSKPAHAPSNFRGLRASSARGWTYRV